jgi:hypothetical protein
MSRGDINGLSWCITSDSQALLAVAVGPTVQIYARKRIKDIQVDEGWALCDEMKLERYGISMFCAITSVIIGLLAPSLAILLPLLGQMLAYLLLLLDKPSERFPNG